MTFYWSDALLFPAIFQGVFLAFVLLTTKSEHKKSFVFLSLLLLCCAFALVGKVAYSRIQLSSIPTWGILPDALIFVFCPLLYVFIKRLLFENSQRKEFLGFTPFFIYLLVVVYFFSIGTSHFESMQKSGEIWVFFYREEAVGLAVNFFYLFKANRLRRLYLKRETQVLSFHQDLLRFIKLFLIIVFVCMVLWGLSFLSRGLLQRHIPYISYTTLWYALPFVTYLVGYYMLTKPHLFRIPLKETGFIVPEKRGDEVAHTEKKVSKANDRLSKQETEKLTQRLKEAFETQHIYLNEKLTLYSLAETIDSSANDLSWLLNQVYKKTFYSFVNEYRLKEFLRKVDNEEHHQKTILALAFESGFNSKATFNKVFKAEMNVTPSAYIKSLSAIQ